MVKYTKTTLDHVFSALSDRTRRSMLERLRSESLTITELASPLRMSLPAVSKHLGVLEKAGLIIREKSGRVHHCQLIAGPMKEAADWLSVYRAFWSTQLDGLAAYLDKRIERKETK